MELRYIPAIQARYEKITLSQSLRDALKKLGIDKFFSHQVEAIDLIRKGENVVVMTPTASGKTLIYNIPVIESIIENPENKALYIFPLKGLEQDQVKNLNKLFYSTTTSFPHISISTYKSSSHFKGSLRFAEIYDGDTTAYRRKKIREAFPNVIFTNPDMLHLALNPFHRKWEGFFRNL
ncbi:MAG: DEAD/DEAH box helicase, partial [Thermodesulfovibrionales bacterium]